MSDTNPQDLALAKALILHEQGNLTDAERIYADILAVDPGHSKALMLLGVCYHSRGEHERALSLIDRSLGIEPDVHQAHYNRGLVLKALDRPEEAIAEFDLAIGLHPSFAAAYCNKANVLKSMNRLDEALAAYDRAIALNPRLAEAYNNRGAVYQMRGQFDAALRNYVIALKLKPDYMQALYNQELVLLAWQHFALALQAFDRVILQDRPQPYSLGYWLQTKKILCDWAGLEQAVEKTLAAVDRGEKAAVPFVLMPLRSTLDQQMKAAQLYVADKYPAARQPSWPAARAEHDRIRLGYVSADYHDHATAHLIAELIERHDRSRFEVIGLSIGPDRRDAMRERMVTAFDAFHDVRDRSDSQIARFARELEIDIAIDLKGLTFESRTGIFALRAAPIQVNYLGYPGSMCAEYIDYLIADPILVPPEHRPFYSEKIAYLPHSYQANDATKAIADATPSRQEMGLPEQGFVYCCFNNAYKLSPEVFDIWMRLLANTRDSVLWLLHSNPDMVSNLRMEARKRGIAPERLVFAPRAAMAEHLARHRLADLFLDTFHYNAHTTASDALWAGLPVLTCLGETFAGRVAASLLRAIGLPELITTSRQEYESVALALAHDPAALTAIRMRIAANRLTQPLFDTARYTMHLEQAYQAMWQRYAEGLPPDHIFVEA